MTAPEQKTPTGTHHFILTLQYPTSTGTSTYTRSGILTPLPGWTRLGVYQALIADAAQQAPETAGANVLFFDLQPNQPCATCGAAEAGAR